MPRPDNDIGPFAIEAGPHGSSIDELYRLHGEWLRALLRRRLRMQSADVDDIVQDTYLRIAKTDTRAIAHPKSYLSQIALNLFRDRKRREAVRGDHRSATMAAAGQASATPGLLEQEAALELARLVEEIPETYRDVFALSRFRHMSNADIAAHLGISVKTVEWRMGKALEFCMGRLRE